MDQQVKEHPNNHHSSSDTSLASSSSLSLNGEHQIVVVATVNAIGKQQLEAPISSANIIIAPKKEPKKLKVKCLLMAATNVESEVLDLSTNSTVKNDVNGLSSAMKVNPRSKYSVNRCKIGTIGKRQSERAGQWDVHFCLNNTIGAGHISVNV